MLMPLALLLAGCGAEKREPIVNAKDGLRYVWVPAGKLKLGCSEGDTECFPIEKTANHTVTITKGFYLGATEVTQSAYRRVMGTNPSKYLGDDLPVHNVLWEDANKYCQAVGGRLPYDAEWELAARGGTAGARYGELNEIAWYAANSSGMPHPVGTKQPNAYGLYDMLGNVLEWTGGFFTHLSQLEATDPKGRPDGEHHTIRGGGWWDAPELVRVTYRFYMDPADTDYNMGFRCALDAAD
jgi:formylglycine-generating enzyme required for sulfatase activity